MFLISIINVLNMGHVSINIKLLSFIAQNIYCKFCYCNNKYAITLFFFFFFKYIIIALRYIMLCCSFTFHFGFIIFFFFCCCCTANGEGIFGSSGGGNSGNPHTKLDDNNCPRQTWIPTPHHSSTHNIHHRTYMIKSFLCFYCTLFSLISFCFV